MNLSSEEFKVSSYIKPVKEFVDERDSMIFDNLRYTSDDIQEYLNWAEENNYTVIVPCISQDQLEELWIKFNMQPRDIRRKCDTKSMELLGIFNQYHYEVLRSDFLKLDIDYPTDMLVAEVAMDNSMVDYSNITYAPRDADKAIEWSQQSGIAIITPSRNLEDLEKKWEDYNSMHLKLRRESDWKSEEIFGISNQRHYDYLKSEYLKERIADTKVEDIHESAFYGDTSINRHKALARNDSIDASIRAYEMLSLISKKNEVYEDAIISKTIDDITTDHIASHQNLNYDVVPYEDMPCMLPDDIIDSESISVVDTGKPYCGKTYTEHKKDAQKWFKEYCNSLVGLGGYDSAEWLSTIRQLSNRLSFDKENKSMIESTLRSYGWDPSLEFNPENRVRARKFMECALSKNIGSSQIIDLRGFTASEYSELLSEAEENTNPLKPVFIVFMEGKTWFSNGVKMKTGSSYSHAGISFDPELRTIYSYGVEGSEKGRIGGFIEEDIQNKDPDKKFGVFAFFLNLTDWQRLYDKVYEFVENVKKTTYSYANIIWSYLFKLPLNKDWSMCCSQFVDRVLKFVDVDLTDKDSCYVTPGGLERTLRKNKKIYMLFSGKTKHYSAKKVKHTVKAISTNAKSIKEHTTKTDPISLIYATMNNIHNIEALREIQSKLDLNALDSRTRKIYENFIYPCLYAESYTKSGTLVQYTDMQEATDLMKLLPKY